MIELKFLRTVVKGPYFQRSFKDVLQEAQKRENQEKHLGEWGFLEQSVDSFGILGICGKTKYAIYFADLVIHFSNSDSNYALK